MRAMSNNNQTEWVVKCLDCGYEKRCGPGNGIPPEESAKRSKAGHIGGGSVYYRNEGPCEDVIAVSAGVFDAVLADLQDTADRYDIDDFYAEGREQWILDRLQKEFVNEEAEPTPKLEDLLIEEGADGSPKEDLGE